jgi:hypothetical protein
MPTTANHQVVVNRDAERGGCLGIPPVWSREQALLSETKDRITSLTNENSILGWTGWWEAAKRRFSN